MPSSGSGRPVATPSEKAVSNDVPSSSPPPSILLPVFVALIVSIVYLSTVYPSVTGGDSGELIITTCNLGIAHPPGYPTYTMVGWSWLQLTERFVPHWQKAFRINALCATLGAIAAGIIAWSTAALALHTNADRTSRSATSMSAALVGLYSGIGFALMPTAWLYSIQGEVFALNNMLCALLIALTVQYYRMEERIEQERERVGKSKKGDDGKITDVKRDAAALVAPVASSTPISPRSLVFLANLGAFVCGVCLTNQHTTVFPVLVTSAFISMSLFKHGLLNGVRVGILILMVIVGMLPYAYILIRSHWQVIDSWGDQRTISGFLKHLLRQEYGTFQLAASEISKDPGMWSRLQVYGSNMRSEMMFVTPILGLLGLFAGGRSSSSATRRTTLVMFLSYLVYVLVFHKLANLDLRPLFMGVQARFWQQANMTIWIFSGMGVQFVAQVIERIAVKQKSGEEKSINQSVSLPYSFVSLSTLLAGLYSLAFVCVHFSSQFPIHNHRTNDSFYTAGVAMLNSFPEDSIVLLNGDLNNNLVKYPQQCEGLRPDLSLLSLQLMSWEWFVPVQEKNYPRVTFPGNRYHISTPGSFHLHLTDFLRRGWSGLARLSTLPPFESWKYGEETWEMVLFRDNMQRLSYLTSFASFNSNKDMSNWQLLQLAYELTEEMRVNEPLLLHFHLMKEYEYRSAGVIYGLWSKHLYSIGTPRANSEADAVGRLMYYAWRKYNLLKPNDPEIFPSLLNQFNPYAGKPIVGLQEEEQYQNLPPLTSPPPPTASKQQQPTRTKSTKNAAKKSSTTASKQ